MLHNWQSDKYYCRESEEVLMTIMRETTSGKWVVYDDKGKLVIISRDKRVCQKLVEKLTSKEKTND